MSTRVPYCLGCDNHQLVQRFEDQKLPYGVGDAMVELSVRVPMYHCDHCGFDFMWEDGSAIRDEAVRKHLESLK